MNTKSGRSTIMEEMEESGFTIGSSTSDGMDIKSMFKKMQQMEAELLALKKSNMGGGAPSSSIQLAMETGKQFGKIEKEIVELKKAVATLGNKENLADNERTQKKEIRELRRQNLELKHAIAILGNKDAASKGQIVGLKDEMGKLRDEIQAIKEQALNNVAEKNGQTIELEQPEPASNDNNDNFDGSAAIMKVKNPISIRGEGFPNEQKNEPILDASQIADDLHGLFGGNLPNVEENEDEEMELGNDEEEEEYLDEEKEEDEPVLEYKNRKNAPQHLRKRSSPCAYCGKTFASNAYLPKHLKLHTGIFLHRCEICNKGFMYPAETRRHMLVHTGEKPFKCNFCGKRYNQKSVLDRHIREIH